MEKQTATHIFESLASGVRLDIYRHLMRKAPSGEVAGRLAAELDIPPTNLSFHLKALVQSGLLSVTQEGRFQRYRANMALMRELINYLTEECCDGQPQLCGEELCREELCSGNETTSAATNSGDKSSCI